ncbi:MAG: alkaline phosphatase, partial [Reyranella sp.]|nr:alkaline phosphatase [Reyranella sp.]
MLGAGALASLPHRVFAQTATATRPRLLQGVQSGDVGGDGATLWSRADRPARMIVEYSTTESFAGATRLQGPPALEATDF